MENQKKSVMRCTICDKPIYSELGKSCKLCGMFIDETEKTLVLSEGGTWLEFCCKKCKNIFSRIHQ